MQMVGPTMESMVVYAPSVGFDTLHDYPVSITGAELESVLPGATQMSGRSLYLSFSQVCKVLIFSIGLVAPSTLPLYHLAKGSEGLDINFRLLYISFSGLKGNSLSSFKIPICFATFKGIFLYYRG